MFAEVTQLSNVIEIQRNVSQLVLLTCSNVYILQCTSVLHFSASAKNQPFLLRDAMHKRGLCRLVVSTLSVRLSIKFMESVLKRINIYSKFFTVG